LFSTKNNSRGQKLYFGMQKYFANFAKARAFALLNPGTFMQANVALVA
jgi:hypothetical protein